MRRTTKIAAVLSAAVLALSACASEDDEEGTESTSSNSSSASEGSSEPAGSEEPVSDIKVGMAYDVGGRGDQSFNDSAAAGLDEAAGEFGFDSEEAEAEDGEDEAAREERLRTFADAGFNPIIAVGFAYEASVTKVAAEYPDVDFAIIDSENVVADNVANLVFAEEQGSFLVGAAAALKSETGNIGFIGGVEVPLIAKFEAGYRAGAEAVNPDIEIQSTYLTQAPDFSGFGDPAKGKTAAEGMFDGGADIVYHAAGGSGGGVFEAASESDNLAIGVDSDQYNTADPAVQDVILTSMLKNVDVAVSTYLAEVAGGSAPTGVTRYDLSVDGVGYSTSGGQVDDIAGQLDELKQQIIDGEITVPTS
ncbi:MAG: nucleoside-binding protein [Nocardioides sp.]|nr:nucleoside-binding protein [Nocardioides sp.]